MQKSTPHKPMSTMINYSTEWMQLTQKIKSLRYELEKAEKAKLNLFKSINKDASRFMDHLTPYPFSKAKLKPDTKKMKKALPKSADINKREIPEKKLAIKILQTSNTAMTMKQILSKLQTKGVSLNDNKIKQSIRHSLYTDKRILKPEKNKFIYVKPVLKKSNAKK